jgi:dihydroorotase
MLTRRRFLSVAAAGAATLSNFADIPELHATQYDLLIKGGRVMDPSRKFDQVSDLAIAGGKIAAVQPNIATSTAAETFDARGRLVVPGLIDIHTHAAREKEDAALCLADGVTSLVDAGSRGSDGIAEIVELAKTSPNRMRLLINISKGGNDTVNGELNDLRKVDVAATRAAIERHRDFVVGIKVRLSKPTAGKNDLQALKLAQSVAGPLSIPIMIHMGQTESPLPDLLAVLKRGDIVTHIYAPPPNGIFDDSGRLLPAVTDAHKRGIVFDIGNGLNKHITWDIAERGIKAGVLPDTISTDWVPVGRTDQVFNLGHVMSKFLLLGMPLDRVIACVTVNAARAMPAFKGLGTFVVGAPADVAIMEIQQGSFEFDDNEHARRTGRMKLVTTATVFGGKRV